MRESPLPPTFPGGRVPVVTVIMPVRNEFGAIRTSLLSILAQDYPKSALEILVVDGDSDDGTPDIVRELVAEHPQVRWVNNPGRIVATALNLGIQSARGEIMARMDAHTEYALDYVTQCVALLLQTEADNVGGPWVARGTTRFTRAVAAAFQSPIGSGGARAHNPSYEGWVDTVYLGCWRKDLFQRVGGFAEDMIRNQDDEHNLRLIRVGSRIWQSPRVRSWYQPRECLGELSRQYCQYGYWKIRIMQKHRRPASFRHVVPAVCLLVGLSLAIVSPWFPAARSALLALLGAHLTLVVLGSVLVASRAGWDLVPLLPVVFYCFHLSYGYGSIRGVLDFVVLRRGAQPRFGRLTRGRRWAEQGAKWRDQVPEHQGDSRPA